MAKCGRGADWESWTQRAVQLARRAVPEAQRVAGSIAPLEDCYRPELSPGAGICRREHRKMARALASAGVDLILCETFPQPGEARVALEAALETGLPVWLSLTLGPGGDLMDRETLLATVREAARDGAAAVLLNCSPVSRISELMPDFADLALQVPFGAYANVGREDPVDGWGHEGEAQPGPYAEAAAGWVAAGARIVGGCCGTTPEHLRALVERLG
jgi:S-methylmethionine-dependent homocysteine/selenocysteine methylase